MTYDRARHPVIAAASYTSKKWTSTKIDSTILVGGCPTFSGRKIISEWVTDERFCCLTYVEFYRFDFPCWYPVQQSDTALREWHWRRSVVSSVRTPNSWSRWRNLQEVITCRARSAAGNCRILKLLTCTCQ